MAFLDIPLSHTLIIMDDVDVPFGRMRIRPKGGFGTHNGMRSVVTELVSKDFPRLRLGLQSPAYEKEASLAEFALSRFSQEEEEVLPLVIDHTADAVEAWLAGMSLDRVMGEWNGKNLLEEPEDYEEEDYEEEDYEEGKR